MKKSIVILSSILLIVSSCVKTASNGKDGEEGTRFSWNGKEGKGPIKEKTITENFTGVEVSSSLKAEVYNSQENKVVISAPDDILDFIEAKAQSDGTMKISIIKNSSWTSGISTKRVTIKVYTKMLNRVAANGSGEITIIDKFTQDNIEVNISGSGEIKGDLEANKFLMDVGSSGEFEGNIWADFADISVNSSGDVKLSGKLQNAEVSISSSGDLEGEKLEIKKGKIDVSSSGSMEAMVSGSVVANASSSGSIKIKKIGNAVITKSESSSGSVSVD